MLLLPIRLPNALRLLGKPFARSATIQYMSVLRPRNTSKRTRAIATKAGAIIVTELDAETRGVLPLHNILPTG